MARTRTLNVTTITLNNGTALDYVTAKFGRSGAEWHLALAYRANGQITVGGSAAAACRQFGVRSGQHSHGGGSVNCAACVAVLSRAQSVTTEIVDVRCV